MEWFGRHSRITGSEDPLADWRTSYHATEFHVGVGVLASSRLTQPASRRPTQFATVMR